MEPSGITLRIRHFGEGLRRFWYQEKNLINHDTFSIILVQHFGTIGTTERAMISCHDWRRFFPQETIIVLPNAASETTGILSECMY